MQQKNEAADQNKFLFCFLILAFLFLRSHLLEKQLNQCLYMDVKTKMCSPEVFIEIIPTIFCKSRAFVRPSLPQSVCFTANMCHCRTAGAPTG